MDCIEVQWIPITDKQKSYLIYLLSKNNCKYKLCDGIIINNISKYHASLIIAVLKGQGAHNRITAKYIYKIK